MLVPRLALKLLLGGRCDLLSWTVWHSWFKRLLRWRLTFHALRFSGLPASGNWVVATARIRARLRSAQHLFPLPRLRSTLYPASHILRQRERGDARTRCFFRFGPHNGFMPGSGFGFGVCHRAGVTPLRHTTRSATPFHCYQHRACAVLCAAAAVLATTATRATPSLVVWRIWDLDIGAPYWRFRLVLAYYCLFGCYCGRHCIFG